MYTFRNRFSLTKKLYGRKNREVRRKLKTGRGHFRASVPLGRYVATKLKPKLGRYVATGLEPKFGRCVAIELFRTSIQHQSMHSRQTFKCHLPKTVASSVHAFRYSKSSIRLCELKTAEISFFIKRTHSKRVELEDGPKGPKTRLEAHPMIS